jgi:uncharacterized protein (DUF433 family)
MMYYKTSFTEVFMSSRYPLNLPSDLKRDAALLAKQQGISLNQFFLWSIAEKVSQMKSSLHDPSFPGITYRRGASAIPTPIIRGTGIRVETIVGYHYHWGEAVETIAENYDIPVEAVREALAFYDAHKEEIDTLIRIERDIVERHGQAETSS